MELSLENVVKTFQLYSGEALDSKDQDRDGLCQALCKDCLAEVQGRLRPEAGEGEVPLAETLAAAEAFVQLALLDQAARPESVSTPELQVRQGDRVRYAQALLEEKRRAAAGVLREDGFFFGQA